MWPGFDSQTRRHMWVESVVGSRPCSERFFSGYSGFPLSSKTNISKFQFDLEPEGHRFVSPRLLFYYLFITSSWTPLHKEHVRLFPSECLAVVFLISVGVDSWNWFRVCPCHTKIHRSYFSLLIRR